MQKRKECVLTRRTCDDLTHLFKAACMAKKLQSKAGGMGRILPKTTHSSQGQPDEFAKQTKEICGKITTLCNFLLENRAAYMRIGQHLKSAAQMTDEQRDTIDRETDKFVSYYTQHLAKLREEWKHAKRKPQQHEHMDAVLDLLLIYLRNVQKFHLQQKKYRVEHELSSYRLLKLAWDKKKIPVMPGSATSIKRLQNTISPAISTDDMNGYLNDAEIDFNMDLNGDWQADSNDVPKPSVLQSKRSSLDSSKASINELKSQSQKVALDEDIQKSQQLVDEEQAKKLSPEDIQMFEQENAQLYEQLQGLSDEVDVIERSVVDIAKLQDIFTEKVSMQQQNIDRIANAVVSSTENVKDANEQIKRAIQRNAGLRVWSLFFLLVMSFTLLFLDWYYD